MDVHVPGAFLATLLLVLSQIDGQVVRFRSCRVDVDVMPNFDRTRYLGTWFEVQRYFPIIFEQNLMCGTATYLPGPTNDTIMVLNRAINRFTRQLDTVMGSAKVVSNAKLNVDFGGDNDASASFGVTPNGNYWVLDTDYESYAVVYSCTEFWATISFEIVWILGRTPTLPQLRIDQIYARLTSEGIDIEPFRARADIQGSPSNDCVNFREDRMGPGQ